MKHTLRKDRLAVSLCKHVNMNYRVISSVTALKENT